jgi:hypothetical protein
MHYVTERVRSLRFGSIVIKVHDGQVVVVESTELTRFQPSEKAAPGQNNDSPQKDSIQTAVNIPATPPCKEADLTSASTRVKRIAMRLRCFYNLFARFKIPSLISSTHPVTVGGKRHELHKFLVLGNARWNAVRVCLLGGMDPGRTETICAAARILMFMTLSPSLAQDYAIFGFPWVANSGFEEQKSNLEQPATLESLWQADSKANDALFLRAEFQRESRPMAYITFRSSDRATALGASVNSKVIAGEVVAPASLRLGALILSRNNPVQVFATDAPHRRKRFEERQADSLSRRASLAF